MSTPEHLGQFSRVDESSNPGEFVTLLDQLRLQAGERKRRTYEMMGVRPGHDVLDVGCGTGADVLALGSLVGKNGRSVGIDCSATMLHEAHKRSDGAEGSVAFEHGDACSLPFADETFDACRCERVLEHIDDPDRALREMARVTRPGGRVVAYEPDWGTVTIDASPADLTERIASFITRSIRSAYIGRQLRRRFREVGLENVQIDADVWTMIDFDLSAQLLRLDDLLRSASTSGVATTVEIDAWLQSARNASRRALFTGSLTFFFAVGTKPKGARQDAPGWRRVPIPPSP